MDRGWRPEAHRHRCVLQNPAPTNLGVALHKAKEDLHRTFEAQHFFDRGFDQRAIFAQAAPQLRPGGEQIEHVANKIGRRLVAGDQQQNAEA
jgi:hypothetical protein